MWNDPAEEWRRLTEHYRSLSDEELRELAADRVDLTQVAQHVLRDEMKVRGLAAPGMNAIEAPKPAEINEDDLARDVGLYQVPPAQEMDQDEHSGEPVEYTWKTQLCECETQEQVWQIAESLRRAGVDSWVQSRGLAYPRVMVAADQLENARVIAVQPIPQDIIDQVKGDAEKSPGYFESPRCPNCGADDPILEGADVANHWRCEACGKGWSETEAAAPVENEG